MNPSRLSKIYTTSYSRSELHLIEIEIMIRRGLPRFDIIGLPQNMIREGRDRVRAAMNSLGIQIPSQKILVNLNPGDIPKEGSHFDLPIFIGILKALGYLPSSDQRDFAWGEMGLDGSIREMEQSLAHLLFAQNLDPQRLLLNPAAHQEFITPFLVTKPMAIKNVSELVNSSPFPDKVNDPKQISIPRVPEVDQLLEKWVNYEEEDSSWNQLKGSPEQFLLFSLLALGRHHCLLEGSPGIGKTFWSQTVRAIQVPSLRNHWTERLQYSPQSSSQITSIHDLLRAPYEAPHHSASAASILGGGQNTIRPGVITRAHGGIMLLDEFPEFHRDVLESLREPLESKTVTIARAQNHMIFPADIQVLATMNPCPCGNFKSKKTCTCLNSKFYLYRSRISGPLRDRFHRHIWWDFIESARPQEFKAIEIRSRIASQLKSPTPNLFEISLPNNKSPRQIRKWLELFCSYCRWFDIQTPSQTDQRNFEYFLQSFQEPAERELSYEELMPHYA